MLVVRCLLVEDLAGHITRGRRRKRLGDRRSGPPHVPWTSGVEGVFQMRDIGTFSVCPASPASPLGFRFRSDRCVEPAPQDHRWLSSRCHSLPLAIFHLTKTKILDIRPLRSAMPGERLIEVAVVRNCRHASLVRCPGWFDGDAPGRRGISHYLFRSKTNFGERRAMESRQRFQQPPRSVDHRCPFWGRCRTPTPAQISKNTSVPRGCAVSGEISNVSYLSDRSDRSVSRRPEPTESRSYPSSIGKKALNLNAVILGREESHLRCRFTLVTGQAKARIVAETVTRTVLTRIAATLRRVKWPKGITDISGSRPDSHTPSTGPIRKRIVDRLDRRLVNTLTAIGFAAPVLVYFWMVHHYSVNVIVGDQWDDVTVIEHSYTHLFDWGSLWAPHNENRIFFPNLVVLLLARTTQFNIQVEEYLSAMMLSATTALLIWVHKRRSPSTPWLYYCPVVLLAFSIVQYGNSLWGFQMAWYMVMLFLGLGHGAVGSTYVDLASTPWRHRRCRRRELLVTSRSAHMASRTSSPLPSAPASIFRPYLVHCSCRIGDPVLLQFQYTRHPTRSQRSLAISLGCDQVLLVRGGGCSGSSRTPVPATTAFSCLVWQWSYWRHALWWATAFVEISPEEVQSGSL